MNETRLGSFFHPYMQNFLTGKKLTFYPNILGQSEGCPAQTSDSELCADNPRVGHILVHALYPLWCVYAN